MNGEVDCEKVLERQFKGVQYIVTLKADSDGLNIQFENKYTGDIWESYYEPQIIQQITTKAGSHKKYNKFIQMITKALPQNFVGDGYELFVDLLTHHDLQMQTNRKNGGPKTTDPKLLNKRYLILSYISTYDKAHYPIPLQYMSQPDSQRLKLTIRRLGQQLQYFQSNPTTFAITKQLSALKHQNQLIKSKLRSNYKAQSKENQNSNLFSKEFQEDNQKLKQQLAALKALKEEEAVKNSKIIQEKDKKITQLQAKIKKFEQNSSQYQMYEQKFNDLSKDTNQIAAALQHSRENEKKSQLKIANLQKQLQKMMSQLKKGQSVKNFINSPRKSDNGSVRSNNSQSKKNITNGSQKKIQPMKNNSHLDSDTQSSKMRKVSNGRVSPYRQTSRPLNNSNSAKKKQSQRVNAISKYSNISNLYNKESRNRSRSKSRSVKKQVSPPSDNFQSSAVMTEGVDYGSDNEEDNKVSETMARLRNHRNKKMIEEKNKGKQKKNSINPIQEKISSIASLMKAFRNNATD